MEKNNKKKKERRKIRQCLHTNLVTLLTWTDLDLGLVRFWIRIEN
jgi:hypothetical protein